MSMTRVGLVAVALGAQVLTVGACTGPRRTPGVPAEAPAGGPESATFAPDGGYVPARPEVRTWGTLHGLVMQGDVGAKVRLAEALGPGSVAVGALEGLAGEVTVWNGTTVFSAPDGKGGVRVERTERPDAGAALLVEARVERWGGVKLGEDVPAEQLDAALGAVLARAGFGPDEAVPVMATARLRGLRWHALGPPEPGAAPAPAAGHDAHEAHMASAVRGELAAGDGVLVGFYSTRHQGVFTHAGKRTHLHVVLDDGQAGHVDATGLAAGTVLFWPVK